MQVGSCQRRRYFFRGKGISMMLIGSTDRHSVRDNEHYMVLRFVSVVVGPAENRRSVRGWPGRAAWMRPEGATYRDVTSRPYPISQTG